MRSVVAPEVGTVPIHDYMYIHENLFVHDSCTPPYVYAHMSIHIDVFVWMCTRILNECIRVNILAVYISAVAAYCDHGSNNK